MSPRPFRASLSQSQGREGWSVIFRHPLKTDKATGKPGRRVRKGLDTRERLDAEEVVRQLNALLGNEDYWSLSAKPTASARFDPRVVKVFYDDLAPENWDFFAVRDGAIPLPSSDESEYKRVLFIGTTGSGKTTLVRQFLGTDPRTERFPSTSTAKTTVADTEVIIAGGPYRAVVTFMPRDQVRDYVEECVSSAVLAAYLGGSDRDVLRKILNHIDQRFRLSYVLGSGGVQDSEVDIDDFDSDEIDFDERQDDIDDIPALDMARTSGVLAAAVVAARELANRHRIRLQESLGGADEDEASVVDEIFEDNLEHLLREDDDFFDVADALIEEVERRFDLLTVGEVDRTTQGWPKLWQWETADRRAFLKAVSRFSSNYAPYFGSLLTPIVNGIRVAGPFEPSWADGPLPLVLLDGEGLGHTPDSASSLPTSVTKQLEMVDAIVLVDNGAQPMQAAPNAVMRSVVAVGQTSKLLVCFTHFDQVTGDNLPTFSAREQHILASADNALRGIGEQLGPWAERALRKRIHEGTYFVGGIQDALSPDTRRGSRSIEQLRRLQRAIELGTEPSPAISATAVYDKTDLVLAVQNAATSFHEGWQARLGRDVRPGVAKEHWTRVKALSRRLAEGSADQYDTLRPVADLHLMLQQELYKAIQHPRQWTPRPPSDDEKQALFDGFVARLSDAIMAISSQRLRTDHLAAWQEAYNQSGRGSSYVRAAIISDQIYRPAAPVTPVLDRPGFLRQILDAVERTAHDSSAELR